MKSESMLFIISTSIILFGCAKKETKSTTSTAQHFITSNSGITDLGSITVGSETFSGAYGSPCTTSGVEDLLSSNNIPSDTKAGGNIILITGNDSIVDENYLFSDTSCSITNVNMRYINYYDNITIGNQSGSNYEISYTLIKQNWLVNTNYAKTWIETTFSSSGLNTSFELGKPQSILIGKKEYNLINVSGDVVNLGKEDNNTYPTDVEIKEYIKLSELTTTTDNTTPSTSISYSSSASGLTTSGSITIGSQTASGTYSTICTEDFSVGSSDTRSHGSVILITDNDSMVVETNFYTDTACKNLAGYWYRVFDNVTIGDQSGNNYKIDYKRSKYIVSPKTTATLSYFESEFSSLNLTYTVNQESEYIISNYSDKNLIYLSGNTIKIGSLLATDYPSDVISEDYINQSSSSRTISKDISKRSSTSEEFKSDNRKLFIDILKKK